MYFELSRFLVNLVKSVYPAYVSKQCSIKPSVLKVHVKFFILMIRSFILSDDNCFERIFLSKSV